MAELRVGALPDGALAAATEFHSRVLPQLDPPPKGEDLVLVFQPADHSHRNWRLAVIQSLAREFAPMRVNGLVSDSEDAIVAALDYLATAAGVTGQLLELDDRGAGEVLSSRP